MLSSKFIHPINNHLPQFIKVSLIQMRLSVLANLRHPAVSRWFMVGKEFVPNEVITQSVPLINPQGIMVYIFTIIVATYE